MKLPFFSTTHAAETAFAEWEAFQHGLYRSVTPGAAVVVYPLAKMPDGRRFLTRGWALTSAEAARLKAH